MELHTITKMYGKTQIITHEYRYDWLVQNIRNCLFKKGEYFESPNFSVDDSNYSIWHLKLFIHDDYIDICPTINKTDTFFIDALVVISILDEHGNASISKSTYLSGDTLEDTTKFFFRKFVKKDNLLKIPSFEMRGDLKISCSFYYFIDVESDSGDEDDVIAATHGIPVAHRAEFEKLLFDSKFSDFALAVGETKIPVHRAILAAHSPVFAAMLSNDMLEKNNGSVTIEDIDIEVMRELLRFVYIRQVDNLDKIADKILIAADRYEVIPLKQICENVLIKKLNLDTIFETLQFIDKYCVATLEKETINFVAKNAKQIAAKRDFEISMKLLSPDLSVKVFRVLMT